MLHDHGHFYANRTRAEYYAVVAGKEILLRMNAQRKTWGEAMSAGTLHYICGEHAHCAVNVGSDAGYDYEAIRQSGFGASVVERNAQPVIVSEI